MPESAAVLAFRKANLAELKRQAEAALLGNDPSPVQTEAEIMKLARLGYKQSLAAPSVPQPVQDAPSPLPALDTPLTSVQVKAAARAYVKANRSQLLDRAGDEPWNLRVAHMAKVAYAVIKNMPRQEQQAWLAKSLQHAGQQVEGLWVALPMFGRTVNVDDGKRFREGVWRREVIYRFLCHWRSNE